jgi:hypothetical protein
MTDERMIFIAEYCPNGHLHQCKYTHQQLRQLLESGTWMFHCKECKLDFPPSDEAILYRRTQLGLD